MKEKKVVKIVCPVCGAEYLPAEIYLPNEFLGKPKNIIKTKQGKIEHFEYSTMNNKEKYECDYCRHTFEITADVKFRTKEWDITCDFIQKLNDAPDRELAEE